MKTPNWTLKIGKWDKLPPRRNESITSVEVWLALSDDRVVRGECLFARPSLENGMQIHDWFLCSDDAGNPARTLAVDNVPGKRELEVVAWALIEVPAHPLAGFKSRAAHARTEKDEAAAIVATRRRRMF